MEKLSVLKEYSSWKPVELLVKIHHTGFCLSCHWICDI
jgi:hypothetical protein